MPDRLCHWYQLTQNPLYAWEAIAEALAADVPTTPDWCIPYLREAAVNMTNLAAVRERYRTSPEVSPKQAMQKAPKALSLARQGKRNAFADLIIDRRDADDAWHSLSEHPAIAPLMRNLALKSKKKKRSVEPDRAERIVARGKRLLHSR